MKLTKYDKVENTSGGNVNIIGGNTTIENNTNVGTRGGGDRTIWGQEDEGDNDIDGTATIHGNVVVKSITPKTYDPDDGDEDGEDIEEEEGGGNLDVEGLTKSNDLEVARDAYIKRHLYINHPQHPDHTETNKKCLGEILGGIEKDLADEVSRAKQAEKDLDTAIKAEKTRAEGAESALSDAIEAEEKRATGVEDVLDQNIQDCETAIKNNSDEIEKLKNRTSANETAIANYLPIGAIIMFSGTMAEIPEGWAICNGENGTPNLIGKFIKAWTQSGVTGGSNSVKLTKGQIPRMELTIDSAKIASDKEWKKRLNKYVPTLDKVEEGVYDEGGTSHYALYTGYKEGDNGLLGVSYPALIDDVRDYTYIGEKEDVQSSVDIEPAYYSLIYICKIA